MKIAILSDLHDNLINLDIFLKKESPDKIIFCGDLTNSETLAHLSDKFKKEINLVSGNAEIYRAIECQHYQQINHWGNVGIIKVEKLTIGFCHEPEKIDILIQQDKKLDYIFYGHTHKPWLEKKSEIILANPGAIGGGFQRASYALLDTIKNKLELKLI